MNRVFGRNYLGPDEWSDTFGVSVGSPPPLPVELTEALAHSECPITPGLSIKDTHLLVLIPAVVGGVPFNALSLETLCVTEEQKGQKLLYRGFDQWKAHPWACQQSATSSWILLCKHDPAVTDSEGSSNQRHLRGRSLAEQLEVRKEHFPNYRDVKTFELMTAVILLSVVTGERLLHNYLLRCEEESSFGGRVCVGFFNLHGLHLEAHYGTPLGNKHISLALARIF